MKEFNNVNVEDMIKGIAGELGLDISEIHGHTAEECAKCKNKDTCPGSKVKGLINDIVDQLDKEEEAGYTEVAKLGMEDMQGYIKINKAKAMVKVAEENVKRAVKEYNQIANTANKITSDFWKTLGKKYNLDKDGDYMIDSDDQFAIKQRVKDPGKESKASDN